MYVVDGYNLLHAMAKAGGLAASAPGARSRLVELLAHLARTDSATVRVFFDGSARDVRPGEFDYPGLSIKFCGEGPESADAAVREYVENATQPAKLRVVSSDRQIDVACRLAGAKIITAQEMARRLAGLAAKGRTPRSGGQEKPIRGRVGRIEQQMIDEIGDLREFEREVERDINRRKKRR